ncbi:hypothetical protein BO94DRAFT_67034 [Aspergillus sclerotioniger CBS 115572]|uniref:Uncharacterized protein n=1 Tax=Aspergillus sclerotioniger CBS 115572 TaxID=1450535 RepID=A0A317WKR3_9EURO|nr:hypothetical protein BO94DRAFT_67034 [Aspergillus sclerotioniger CBS 115572]PWY87086.1 hypothetical protein BO94DRAFT_67034 [Aspergillus sclerotioniger CBS 115572]
MQYPKLVSMLLIIVPLAGLTTAAPVADASAEPINGEFTTGPLGISRDDKLTGFTKAIRRVPSADDVDLKAIGDVYKM